MRTIEEIKTEMAAAQATIPELSELDSSSNMSLFGHLKNMWALLVQMLEGAWERKANEVEEILKNNRVGSALWYAEQAKLFQFGDSVTVINNKVQYREIDPVKQIVKQAVCVEDAVSGRLLIKIAKANGTQLTGLSSEELTAFRAYVNDFKYAGVQVDIVSSAPDQLRLFARCKYDRQVLSNTGTLLSDPSQNAVQQAIQSYLNSLPFDGVLSWTGLTDHMQKIPGVLDFVITKTEIAPNATNFWSEFSGETLSNAGHLFFAEGTITYI